MKFHKFVVSENQQNVAYISSSKTATQAIFITPKAALAVVKLMRSQVSTILHPSSYLLLPRQFFYGSSCWSLLSVYPNICVSIVFATLAYWRCHNNSTTVLKYVVMADITSILLHFNPYVVNRRWPTWMTVTT